MACETWLHSADNNLRLEMAQLLVYGLGGLPALGGPGAGESSTPAEDVSVLNFGLVHHRNPPLAVTGVRPPVTNPQPCYRPC